MSTSIIGGEGFIPGFSEQMEGLSPGETRTIQVPFPAELRQMPELAGKAADLRGDRQIQGAGEECRWRRMADDAFAKELGLDSAKMLRTRLHDQIAGEYAQMSRHEGEARAAGRSFPSGPSSSRRNPWSRPNSRDIWRQVEQRKESRPRRPGRRRQG